jgi:c-di-GMP-binding flagellar brake protein YcgR
MNSMEARLSQRKPCQGWARVFPEKGPGFSARLADLSPDGLALLHTRALASDSFCHVVFFLPHGHDQTMVQARCRVTGCRPDAEPGMCRIGLQFVTFISDEQAARRAIAAWLAEN